MHPLSFSNHAVTLVSTATGVRADAIRGRTRVREAVNARHLAMFLACRVKGLPLNTIGKQFERDHTSVLYGVTKVEARAASDPDFAAFVQTLSKEAEIVANAHVTRTRERKITQGAALPERITTSQVCDLAGYGPQTLAARVRLGKMPAHIDKGVEKIFDRDAVLKALGLLDQPRPEEASW